MEPYLELLVVLGMLLLLDLASLLWAHDSRDQDRGFRGAGGLLPDGCAESGAEHQ